MLVGVTGYSLDAEEAQLRTYLQHSPDGVILTGVDHNPGVWQLLRTAAIPAVHTIETLPADSTDRSEERRVGKECVSTCRSRWSPSHIKKKKHKIKTTQQDENNQ